MKMIIESRCKLCGAMVTDCRELKTKYLDPVAFYTSIMTRKAAQINTHDCGRGRTGVLEVMGMFPADEPEEKEKE